MEINREKGRSPKKKYMILDISSKTDADFEI